MLLLASLDHFGVPVEVLGWCLAPFWFLLVSISTVFQSGLPHSRPLGWFSTVILLVDRMLPSAPSRFGYEQDSLYQLLALCIAQ